MARGNLGRHAISLTQIHTHTHIYIYIYIHLVLRERMIARSKTLSDYASLVHLETLLKIQPEAVYQQNVHDCLFREPSKKEIDYFVSLSKEADAEFLAKLIKDHAMADWRPTLPHLQCPCLVIYGEQSKIFPEDAALYLADKLPRKMIQPFKFAGHWPYYEMPERFNDVIHDFIRNRMQQL